MISTLLLVGGGDMVWARSVRIASIVFSTAVIAATTLDGLPAQAGDEDSSNAQIYQGDAPSVPGPMRTIAVGQIDTIGPLAPPGSGWNVGGSISAMLTTALEQSKRVIVVERNALSQVLTEQQMQAHGVSGGTAAPATGSVVPAQYLVVGSVTEFGAANNGGGLGIGGSSGLFNGGLAYNDSNGNVAIDFRVVDTRTTNIVSGFKVDEKISSSGLGFTGGYSGVSLSGNKFWSTPLGEATRKAVSQAVDKIVEAIASGKWQGAVVEVDGGIVYVNGGAAIGLKNGDRLQIQRVGKRMTDPTTGAVLSEEMNSLGMVQLNSIQEKIASGQFMPMGGGAPARGDLVVFQP
jgi:curli biogenesis system outer membrane secretion channel CsgG